MGAYEALLRKRPAVLCLCLGAAIGFSGTTFDVSEKKYGYTIPNSIFPTPAAGRYASGIIKTIEVRHLGIHVSTIEADFRNPSASGEEFAVADMHRSESRRIFQETWGYRLIFVVAWAITGMAVGTAIVWGSGSKVFRTDPPS
jgi:hypothetical protein